MLFVVDMRGDARGVVDADAVESCIKRAVVVDVDSDDADVDAVNAAVAVVDVDDDDGEDGAVDVAVVFDAPVVVVIVVIKLDDEVDDGARRMSVDLGDEDGETDVNVPLVATATRTDN